MQKVDQCQASSCYLKQTNKMFYEYHIGLNKNILKLKYYESICYILIFLLQQSILDFSFYQYSKGTLYTTAFWVGWILNDLACLITALRSFIICSFYTENSHQQLNPNLEFQDIPGSMHLTQLFIQSFLPDTVLFFFLLS